jgi:hypothetical protein
LLLLSILFVNLVASLSYQRAHNRHAVLRASSEISGVGSAYCAYISCSVGDIAAATAAAATAAGHMLSFYVNMKRCTMSLWLGLQVRVNMPVALHTGYIYSVNPRCAHRLHPALAVASQLLRKSAMQYVLEPLTDLHHSSSSSSRHGMLACSRKWQD